MTDWKRKREKYIEEVTKASNKKKTAQLYKKELEKRNTDLEYRVTNLETRVQLLENEMKKHGS